MHLRTTVIMSLLAVLAASSPAAGQVAPQQDGKGVGFGIRGVGPEASRGYFFFRDVEPGRAITARVAITNTTRAVKQVVLRAQDTTTSGSGGLSYTRVKDGPGRWIVPRERTVSVPGGETSVVDLRVELPDDVDPGDHIAGLVAYDKKDLQRLKDAPASEQAVQLKFISRLALPIRVRVPGKLLAEVALRDVKLDVSPSGSSVQVIFANTGNVIIPSSEGRVNVSQGDLVLGSQKIGLTTFTPGSTITVAVPFEGAPAEATYVVKGFLEPMFAPVVNFDESVTFGGQESDEFEEETGIGAVGSDDGGLPVWVWVVLGLAIVLLAGLLRQVLRARRALRSPAAGDAAGSPAPTPAESSPPVAGQVAIDINTATAGDLARLPGVGPAAAQRIVDYREEYGRFGSVDDLERVEGFDADRVSGLRETASAGGG